MTPRGFQFWASAQYQREVRKYLRNHASQIQCDGRCHGKEMRRLSVRAKILNAEGSGDQACSFQTSRLVGLTIASPAVWDLV